MSYRILIVCKKCGQTHYEYEKPERCTHCNRKLNKGLHPLQVYQC